ncbi:hypothetical protein ANN_04169 [Periplaneta americana]|uniref:Uncharacterized protein n=1 Tax=Periplaneta americana TaxID=6978 RepID=A0ABQ8T911_PERAM|nr:hypothetical protein ANN_04169 [Periplaneta americana]
MENKNKTKEIRGLYKELDLVVTIKIGRLKWLEHIQRMATNRALNDQPGGTRMKGRPRVRWLDDVETDLRITGVKRWRRKAESKDDPRTAIKEAKVLRNP